MRTIQDIKLIPIRDYLAHRGITPKQENTRYGFYLSPFREEQNASFKVNYTQNLWYDFGAGRGGSIIDLVMEIEMCDFQQAVERLRNDSIDHIVDSFRMQASLNPIAKPVAHISLDFSVQDKERLTNKMMMQIADEYLRRMGYGDTQVLIVRHNDREHPHLVLNRIDGNGKRISDRNERVRNVKVCKELSDKYGLYRAPNKENVKRHRLRETDKTKYEIYDAIRNALPRCRNWNDLITALHKQGINTEFKSKGTTSTIEGVKFSKNGYTFSGSKVDKAFSYSKLNRYFAQTQQRISQQPTPGKRMKMAANNYRSVFSGLFGNNNPSVTQGIDMGAYGVIALPPFDSPIKLSAAQLQRRVGESPEEHLARVTALLNQIAEAMAIAIEDRKQRLRNVKPKKSTLKL